MLRKKQYTHSNISKIIAHELIAQKIKNQAALLTQLRTPAKIDKSTAASLVSCAKSLPYDREQLMGTEGLASKMFFKTYFRNLGWIRRAPRCKEDIPNVLMDIGYTYLFNFMECLLALYGFDLYCGVYHTFFYHRKSLVCDFVEPFRCIIDKRIRKAYALAQIHEEDFFFNRDHWELKYQRQMHYVKLFMKDIMERKEEMFVFVRKFYLWFMNEEADIQKFPQFQI